MKKRARLFAAAVLLGAPSGWGRMHIVDTTDFVTGVNTGGWTFTAQGWTSPTYPTNAVSFTLTGTNLAEGATLAVSYARNAFTIVPSGGAQPAVFSAAYTLSKLPPPDGLVLTNVIDGAFAASWTPVEDAIGYRVTICSNLVEGASSGTALFTETFGGVSDKGTVTAIDGDTFNGMTDTQAGWRIHLCYHGVTPAAGVVQIGSSANLGWLALPIPAGCLGPGRTLCLTAERFANAGRDMPIAIVSADGTETNAIGSVTLDTTTATHHLPLPTLRPGDTLYLHSTTNKIANKDKDGRVLLDDVRILEGYDPGHVRCVQMAAFDMEGTAFATNGLTPFAGSVSVMARAANAPDDSDPATAVLDLLHPPLMPILRAVPLSQYPDGTYAADFSVLSNITAATTWYNGVWPIPYWMGYNDLGGVVTSIRKATTNTTYSGFFAFNAPHEPTLGWVLGFRGSASRDFHHGIAFLNDTAAPRTDITLSFEAVQWNYRNEIPMTNTVEYLVSDTLVGTAAQGSWTPIPAFTVTPPYTASYNDGGAECWRNGPRCVTLDGVTLEVGRYLIVRFTDLRTPTSGGIGIADFRFTSVRKPLTNCIIFR